MAAAIFTRRRRRPRGIDTGAAEVFIDRALRLYRG